MRSRGWSWMRMSGAALNRFVPHSGVPHQRRILTLTAHRAGSNPCSSQSRVPLSINCTLRVCLLLAACWQIVQSLRMAPPWLCQLAV